MTVRLRFAGPADIAVIMAVMADAFDPRFGEAWSAAQLLGSLASPDTWVRLALVDDGTGGERPVGFSVCRRVGPEAELLLVGVALGDRGQGFGAALLTAAKRDAARRGVETMFLEVRDGNSAAQALYRAGGFVIVGRRRDYYRGGGAERFDAITMRSGVLT